MSLFSYHLILLQEEAYRVVTRSKTKTAGTQLSKVHGADKVVNPKLKPKAQVKREGILKFIPVVLKPVPQPQSVVLLVQCRKGGGRSHVEIRSTGLRPQLILQPQPIPTPPAPVPPVPVPPISVPTSLIPSLGERPSPKPRINVPIQCRYELPARKDPILPSPYLSHSVCL